MIDLPRFISEMFGYIGWQKGYRPNDPNIKGNVLTSTSGLTFNSESNTLELEVLQSIAPQFKLFGQPIYNVATSYSIGDGVILNNDAYTSLTNLNVGTDPATDDVNWSHDFSEWLDQKTNSSLRKLGNNLVARKQLNKQTKSIIDQVYLFDSAGSKKDLIAKSGRIVGFAFDLIPREGLVMLLQKVGVQLSATEAGLTLYLFHTSQIDAPIATITVQGNTAFRFQWYDSGARMPFLADYNVGGSYKLVYYEDDLTGSAVNYKLDSDGLNLPCSTCSGGNRSQYFYNRYSPWMSFQAFYVDAVNIPGTPLEMWDTTDEQQVDNTNFGLNVQIGIRCDVTDLITQNKDVFNNAIILQMQMDMAKEAINNTNENSNERKVTQDAFLALEGGERDLKSLSKQLDEEMDKMDFNLSRLGTPCFPCEKKGGINIGYI